MRRIAITNQKGGVGKTTTTANLAAALGQAGQRVLLVDLDPQSHLTTHFGLDGAARAGTYELLTENTPIADMLLQSEKGLTLIRSRMDLAAAEAELISVVGREVILRDRLAEIQDRFDWLLIDCPPSFGVLTLNALSTVSEVLVPLQAHFLGLQGVGKLLETVNLVSQRINPALRVAGFVLCMYESGTKLAKEVVDDLQRFLTDARGQNVAWRDAKLFATRVRRNIKLAECPSYGKSIFAYAPESNGALDYLALAEELVGAIATPMKAASAAANAEPVAAAPDPNAARAPRAAKPETAPQAAPASANPPVPVEQPSGVSRARQTARPPKAAKPAPAEKPAEVEIAAPKRQRPARTQRTGVSDPAIAPASSAAAEPAVAPADVPDHAVAVPAGSPA